MRYLKAYGPDKAAEAKEALKALEGWTKMSNAEKSAAIGKVAAVGMVTNVPARVQRVVIGALEQWRFEPLPSDRVHRVELLFNGD